jgi:hypothetical protein
MTRRYVKAWYHYGEWRDEGSGSATIDVIERERAPEWTGLYDAAGVKIMAVDEPPPIGFLREVIR